jgi:hypothetical protein
MKGHLFPYLSIRNKIFFRIDDHKIHRTFKLNEAKIKISKFLFSMSKERKTGQTDRQTDRAISLTPFLAFTPNLKLRSFLRFVRHFIDQAVYKLKVTCESNFPFKALSISGKKLCNNLKVPVFKIKYDSFNCQIR